MKLVVRYALSISLLLAAFALTLIVTLTLSFNVAFNDLVKTSEANTKKQLEEQNTQHLINVAQQLGSNIQNALYFYDIEAIEQLIEISQVHPDIEKVVLLDKDRSLIHDGTKRNANFGSRPFNSINWDQLTLDRPLIIKDENTIQLFLAIGIEEMLTGYIVLVGNTTNSEDLLANQNQGIRSYAQQILENSFLSTALVFALMIVIGLFVASLIARNLTNPIKKLVRLARDIGAGKLSTRVSLNRKDELAILAESLNHMAESMEQRNNQIQYQANHDALTALPNRRAIHTYIDGLLAKPQTGTFAVLFIDLDDFKLLNDIYGHTGGDNALRTLALRLERSATHIEKSGVDKVSIARISGDEFLLVLESERIKERIGRICQGILEDLAKPFEIENHEVSVTLSIGVAIHPQHGHYASELISKADMAMYMVKDNSKYDYHIYQESYDLVEQQRLALIKDFSKSFDKQELELWYQPQFDINSGVYTGSEALLRWKHSEHGYMSPGQFLPYIENHELMHRLTLWVLETVSNHCRNYRHLYKQPNSLAINISPEQLNRADVLASIKQLTDDNNHLLRNLHIEITETGFVSQSEQTHKNIESLRALGLKFWLDDFGTGYSSFRRLKELPIDGIKIDRSFVTDISNSEGNLAIVKSMIATARAFNISIIAEGVETAEELTVLQQLGAETVQGFFTAHPMPESQYASMMEQNILSPNHHITRLLQVKAS